ncbi:sulfatase domain protein [gamma proteobacterium NOR5-3]|nr:sulfatase domain protein [gamma proteobacterium NOR5-3]
MSIGIWQTEAKVNGPLELKIGLHLETSAEGKIIEFYCHKNKSYLGSSRVTSRYSPENKTAPNAYKIISDISCGPESTHLRFDPLPADGVVAITKMRVHTRYWHTVDLRDAIDHIKPINSIESVELIDDQIVIVSVGSDPYVELTDQLQSFVATDRSDYLGFLAQYAFVAFILLKIVLPLLEIVMRNGHQVADFSHAAKRLFDQVVSKIVDFTHRFFAKPITLNGFLLVFAFSIYGFSSYIFTGHLIKNGDAGFFSTLLFIALQFCFVTSVYIALLGAMHQHTWYRVIVGFCLLAVSFAVWVDVSLFSLNGMHLSQGLAILTDGGVGRFFDNLRFTGLSFTELGLYVAALFTGILLSLSLVWFLEHRGKRFQLRFSIYQSMVVVLFAIATIYIAQSLSAPKLNAEQIFTYQDHHPIGLSFFDVKDYLVSFDAEAKPYQRNDVLPADAGLTTTSPISNVYLFVFESLREDMVNQQITPYLSTFRQNSWRFSKSVASGNATHYGWFSIINSKQPFEWERYKRLTDKQGSVPLQVFRQLGFTINIYSAKDLSYLQSDQIMFGQDLSLADYISPHPDMSPPDHDERITKDLIADINDRHKTGKNLNIVFLDSTHYPYRWKSGAFTEITPYQGTPAEGTDVSSAVRIMKNDRQLIVNRYKNAIKYMDYLFGKSVGAIRDNNLTDRSVIVAVGDHGQQFMENGYMLHGFTLFNEDIDVPIYFQTPGTVGFVDDKVASHVDIMPTLLDQLNVDLEGIRGIQGSSLINDSRHNYKLSSVAGEQNTPSSFVVSSPDWKLFFRTERSNPAYFKKIYVTKITDKNDKVIVPGAGLRADYVGFVNQYFPDFLQQTPIMH